MVRPRSILAHEKVLNAAISLFSERGIEGASMDAIARESGVSKATIYNHWTNKEALLLEVMLYVNGLHREPEDVDTGDLKRDLTIVLTRKPPDEFEYARDRMMASLIAYSAIHTEFGAQWRHSVMEPPRQCIKRALQRGMERGVLSRNLDLETCVALLLGPMLYTHIFHKDDPDRRPDIGEQVAETFCCAYEMQTKEASQLPRRG